MEGHPGRLPLTTGPVRPTWARLLALGLFALVLTTYAWAPMLATYPHTQNGDGQLCFHYFEAARVAIVRYHELPLWDPYQCAGLPLWDNPTAYAGSPVVLAAIFLGTTKAVYVWIIAHVAMGFVGMWLLARHELGLGRWGAFVAAGAWAYSGFHQHHYSGGHLPFVGYLWFPLAILLWRRAERDLRCGVGLGMLLALMFYEGAVYPLPHLVVVLAVESLTRVWPPKRILYVARAAGVVGLVAFTLAASRLLPVFDQLRSHTRPIEPDVDAMHWQTLVDMFLARSHERFVPGQQYVWTEFGTYMGPIVLALALFGLLAAGRKRLWMLPLLLLCFALMLGHVSEHAPWHVLHAHVPPFKEMRVPSRFRAPVSMFLAAYAGIAVEALVRFAERRVPSRQWGRAIALVMIAVALLGVGDIITVGTIVIAPFFGSPPATPQVPSPSFFYGGADLAPFIDQPAQNRGRFDCYDEWGFGTGAPLWVGDVPQARATDANATVLGTQRTQSTITIDVDVRQPTRILANTSYDRGWRTDVGSVAEQNKQLVVDLPPGHHRVHLRYWPHGLTAGLVLTAFGAAGVLAYWIWVVRRRMKTGSYGE